MFFGRLDHPTTSATIQGLCGDEMTFDLAIRKGIIEEVRYFTDGCAHTKMCGVAVARRAQGATVMDALGINPREIIATQEYLPEEGKHCAILAVTTLYRAIAAYLLAPAISGMTDHQKENK